MDTAVKPLALHEKLKQPKRPSREDVEAAIRTLIAWTGDDPEREGLKDTPGRVASVLLELYAGYSQDPRDVLDRQFPEIDDYQDMVLVREIPFHSHCEHHMLPFRGKAHIAYYPTNGVVGLSKLARLVDVFARRLQTQETLTVQIRNALEDSLGPRGVAVMIEAEHMCMVMRGVSKSGSSTMTSCFTGVFQDDAAEREKFLRLIRSGKATAA